MKRCVNTLMLKETMRGKGLNMIKICQNSGVSYSTVKRVFSGLAKPNSEVIGKLAMILELNGAEIDEIFFAANLHNE